jgi:protein-S-isoprenylcysteine O-methyltransferase Ste14
LSWIVIPIVERHMLAFCGDEYKEYCSKVRMWI